MLTSTPPTAIIEGTNAELGIFDKLRAYRVRVAELRGLERHWQASFMRDELLSELEHYLDPAGMERHTTLQAIQGRAAVELASERIENIPF